ncbi:MAG: hypothetical protein WCB27_17585 [Thermoguttaceae bacterium]
METIKKVLADIQALNPDEIRERLSALDTESKELRKLLRVRLSAKQRPIKQEAAPCK